MQHFIPVSDLFRYDCQLGWCCLMEKRSRSTSNAIRRRRVCLFGTSANPPTGIGGHVGIVKALATMGRNELDEIRILPVYHHPFSKKRNDMVSYQDRLTMCRLAFQNSDTQVQVTISNAEERCFEEFFKDKDDQTVDDRRVGTADLLDMLRREEPNSDFSFCLGADTFVDLLTGKWKRSQDVIQLLKGRLWVIPRLTEPASGNDLSSHQELLLQERLLLEQIDRLNHSEGIHEGSARLLSIPYLQPISSTLARNSRDVAQLETLLVPSVLAFIQEHRLYAFQQEAETNEDKRTK